MISDQPLISQKTHSQKCQKFIKNFNELMHQIQKKSHWKEIIIQSCKKFNIKLYNLEKLTPNKVKIMYQSIVKKFYFVEKIKNSWHENELRVFIWTLINFSDVTNKNLQNFQLHDWQQIAKYFMNKSAELCNFQYNLLKKYTRINIHSQKWTPEQDKLLYNIVINKQQKNKWNQVAKEIFCATNFANFKNPKQCRQRWYNYLDPTKIKGAWTLQEDIALIKIVISKGKKWALIAKSLQNKRTEHMVKNRFKSLIIREEKLQRKNNKKLGEQFLIQQLQSRLLKKKEDKSNSIQLNVQNIKNNNLPQNVSISNKQFNENKENEISNQQQKIKIQQDILQHYEQDQLNNQTRELNQQNLINNMNPYEYIYYNNWFYYMIYSQQSIVVPQNALIYEQENVIEYSKIPPLIINQQFLLKKDQNII